MILILHSHCQCLHSRDLVPLFCLTGCTGSIGRGHLFKGLLTVSDLSLLIDKVKGETAVCTSAFHEGFPDVSLSLMAHFQTDIL